MSKKTDKSSIKHVYSKNLPLEYNKDAYNSMLQAIEEDKQFLYNNLNEANKKIFLRFVANSDKVKEILVSENFIKGVDLGIKIARKT